MTIGSRSEIPLNPNAKELFLTSVEAYSRILVLGGSGWFGRTALAMLGPRVADSIVIGSHERTIIVGNRQIQIRTWSRRLVDQFNPDLVLDFAFLTRDFESTLGAKKFRAINSLLSSRLVELSRMASVQKILTISSGASVVSKLGSNSSTLDTYGQQKLATENALKAATAQSGVEVAVARAWSVSGGHVQKYRSYAFSDLIHSAVHGGPISVKAKNLVTRRYCSVEDFLAVVLASSQGEPWAEIDSGGPLVEMAELAEAVAQEVGRRGALALSKYRDTGVTDAYHSDNTSWVTACESTGANPLTLGEQIRNVRLALSEFH